MNPIVFKPRPEDGTVKMPGETNPDFARVVTEYMQQFHCVIHLDKRNLDRKELYQWCTDHLGEKYKDWFIYEGGGYDKVWVIHIKSPKKSTFFRLKYNDIIVKSVDKHPS